MIKLATVFSGIGAIESALEYMNEKYEIVFACDNGERELKESYEEIDKMVKGKSDNNVQFIINNLYKETGKENYVKQTYFANYGIKDNQWYEDIKYLDGKKFKNQIDLYVGGSPCQSFSVNGKRAGLKDIRGTLFYEYCRIVDESRPKVFIYENVRGMINHDKGKTWKTVKDIFSQLDYDIYIHKKGNIEDPILNSKDYGIPQNRERLYIVGFRKDLNIQNFKFPLKEELKTRVADYLEENVDAKYYLKQKGFEFVTSNPSRARVGTEIMGCQKANQQFNWNGDFIFEPLEKVQKRADIMEQAYVGTWNGQRGVCRKFTPKECLRLMGFRDTFRMIHKDEIMYRQAGNSIVVNVLMRLIEAIKETGVWSND